MHTLIIAVIVLFLIILALNGFFGAGKAPDNEAEGAKGESDRVVPVAAGDFRVPGETAALLAGIVIMAVILVVLLRVTFGVILALLAVSIFWLKVRQGQLLGQAVQVGPQQLPAVFARAKTASNKLHMPMPDVFVVQNPVLNAFALGFFGRKSIVINSATVEAMDEDELCFVIGHEFTHIKCAHTHWLVLTNLSDTIRLPVVSSLIGFVLRGWSRRAEYTSDRGGLIACQNLRAAISAIAKLAVGKTLFEQLDIEQLMHQKEAVDSDLVAKLSEALGDHPYIVNRVQALHEFSRTEYFKKLSTPRPTPG